MPTGLARDWRVAALLPENDLLHRKINVKTFHMNLIHIGLVPAKLFE
jgi:hypothetical protein